MSLYYIFFRIPQSCFYHEILKADPRVVDLRKMGPYYYDFGRLLVDLVDADVGESIAKILLWVKIFFLSNLINNRLLVLFKNLKLNLIIFFHFCLSVFVIDFAV